MPAAIAIRGLTKYYGRTRGIEDLDLEVEEGEIFGFIGPNGAGKTTTIRILLGLVRPTSGSVSVLGRPVPPGGGPWLAEVGYLPSEVAYYPDLTGHALLDYAAGFYPRVDRRWVAQLVERLQLDLSRPVRSYSLGNRKKLGIVQALLHRPRLLILDEPSSGLDPLIRAEVFDLLREVNAAGTTVFFSTHVLDEVDRLCHRVAMVRDGRLLHVAPVADLPGRHMRVVTLRLAAGAPLPGELLARWGDPRPEPVPGKPGTYRLLVRAPVQELVAALAPLPLEDLTVGEPGIEDVFLTMYRSGDRGPVSGHEDEVGSRQDGPSSADLTASPGGANLGSGEDPRGAGDGKTASGGDAQGAGDGSPGSGASQGAADSLRDDGGAPGAGAKGPADGAGGGGGPAGSQGGGRVIRTGRPDGGLGG